MPPKSVNPLLPTTVRFAAAELEEIDQFVARAGVRRSDFLRSAVLSRLREADAFARSVPESIDQVERKLGRLHELVSQQSAIIQTLVGASMAQIANTVDYTLMSKEEADRQASDAIWLALKSSPAIVKACIQQYPELQDRADDLPRGAR